MNNKNIVDIIVEKGNTIIQALNNVETKGRVSLNNLCGAMNLVEQLANAAIAEIDRLNKQINELKPADIEK